MDKREAVNNRGAWWDYRRVSITVRGLKADVVAGIEAIRTVFNRSMTLSLPSGARFLRWWPDQSDKLEQEEPGSGKHAGEDVWRGIVEGVVWSVRTE